MQNKNNELLLLKSNDQYNYIDILFWLSIIFYLNPGGFVSSFISLRIAQPILLVIIWFLFLFVSRSFIKINLVNKSVVMISFVCFVFFLYYSIVFLFINDFYTSMNIVEKLLKTRLVYTSWLLFLPVCYFTVYRSNRIFLNLFCIISLVVFFLLMEEIYFNLGLMQVNSINRGFFNVDRHLLVGYGLLEMGLYLPFSIYILPRINFKEKRFYTICSLLIFLIYFLSLTRRYFIFIILSFFISSFLSRYLFKKSIISKFSFISISVVSITLSYFLFSEHFNAMLQSINTLFFGYGTTHRRLSLYEHAPTLDMIKNNLWFGSGYINEWYTNNTFFEQRVDTDFGLSGSDYVFLSTIGMFGIVGIVTFLPLYYILISNLISGVKFVKKYFKLILRRIDYNIYPLILFITTIIFFSKHIISYPNWFSFIGPTSQVPKYYILLGLFIGSIQKIKNNVSLSK